MAWQFPPSREDDDLGPPPPPFRIRRRRIEFPSFGSYNKLIFLAVGLLLAYVVLSTLKTIYVDYLWFDSTGFGSVYEKRIITRAWLFAGGALVFLVYFGINVFLAAKPLITAPPGPRFDDDAAVVRRVYQLALIAATLFFAVIFGTIAASKWDLVLSFLDGESFGVRRPGVREGHQLLRLRPADAQVLLRVAHGHGGTHRSGCLRALPAALSQ